MFRRLTVLPAVFFLVAVLCCVVTVFGNGLGHYNDVFDSTEVICCLDHRFPHLNGTSCSSARRATVVNGKKMKVTVSFCIVLYLLGTASACLALYKFPDGVFRVAHSVSKAQAGACLTCCTTAALGTCAISMLIIVSYYSGVECNIGRSPMEVLSETAWALAAMLYVMIASGLLTLLAGVVGVVYVQCCFKRGYGPVSLDSVI